MTDEHKTRTTRRKLALFVLVAAVFLVAGVLSPFVYPLPESQTYDVAVTVSDSDEFIESAYANTTVESDDGVCMRGEDHDTIFPETRIELTQEASTEVRQVNILQDGKLDTSIDVSAGETQLSACLLGEYRVVALDTDGHAVGDTSINAEKNGTVEYIWVDENA